MEWSGVGRCIAKVRVAGGWDGRLPDSIPSDSGGKGTGLLGGAGSETR
jgi:hypothetical protein